MLGKKYIEAVRKHDVVFGARWNRKDLLSSRNGNCSSKERPSAKIILTRPAVEAGENLGFLPGDLKEKLILTYARL